MMDSPGAVTVGEAQSPYLVSRVRWDRDGMRLTHGGVPAAKGAGPRAYRLRRTPDSRWTTTGRRKSRRRSKGFIDRSDGRWRIFAAGTSRTRVSWDIGSPGSGATR